METMMPRFSEEEDPDGLAFQQGVEIYRVREFSFPRGKPPLTSI